jgi:hypothetical protein
MCSANMAMNRLPEERPEDLVAILSTIVGSLDRD